MKNNFHERIVPSFLRTPLSEYIQLFSNVTTQLNYKLSFFVMSLCTLHTLRSSTFCGQSSLAIRLF